MIVWEVPIKTPNGRKRAGRVIYIKRLYKYKKNITSDKTYDLFLDNKKHRKLIKKIKRTGEISPSKKKYKKIKVEKKIRYKIKVRRKIEQ